MSWGFFYSFFYVSRGWGRGLAWPGPMCCGVAVLLCCVKVCGGTQRYAEVRIFVYMALREPAAGERSREMSRFRGCSSPPAAGDFRTLCAPYTTCPPYTPARALGHPRWARQLPICLSLSVSPSLYSCNSRHLHLFFSLARTFFKRTPPRPPLTQADRQTDRQAG